MFKTRKNAIKTVRYGKSKLSASFLFIKKQADLTINNTYNTNTKFKKKVKYLEYIIFDFGSIGRLIESIYFVIMMKKPLDNLEIIESLQTLFLFISATRCKKNHKYP